jgi:propanediol dehydratase small subunit
MARKGAFDATLEPRAWFDSKALPEGWFADELIPAPTSGNIQGSASITLDNFTLVATGVLGNPPITANSNITLDPVTVSSTGKLNIAGALSKTLDDFTLVATASLLIRGNASITLDNFTLVATGVSGTPPITANASITLDPVTVSSTGKLAIAATLSRTLDDFTLVSTASLLIRGNANITLDPFTLASTGTLSTPSGSCPSANEIAQAVWNYLLEGSVSAGQMLRGVTRTQLARVDINETTGQVTIYKLDGTTVFAQASTSPTGDRNAPTVDWN